MRRAFDERVRRLPCVFGGIVQRHGLFDLQCARPRRDGVQAWRETHLGRTDGARQFVVEFFQQAEWIAARFAAFDHLEFVFGGNAEERNHGGDGQHDGGNARPCWKPFRVFRGGGQRKANKPSDDEERARYEFIEFKQGVDRPCGEARQNGGQEGGGRRCGVHQFSL